MGLLKPRRVAHAHCHVPCGIYDPTFAVNAAETVLKMVEQLDALEPPGSDASAADHVAFALGRLDDFDAVLEPPPASSLAELEAAESRPSRRRGRI